MRSVKVLRFEGDKIHCRVDAENTRTIDVVSEPIFRRETEDFARKRVFQYITAGDSDEQVPDVSVFMKYFLEVLDPAKGISHRTGLGEFTSRDVCAYVLQPEEV